MSEKERRGIRVERKREIDGKDKMLEVLPSLSN
jgi:hypothetical protein